MEPHGGGLVVRRPSNEGAAEPPRTHAKSYSPREKAMQFGGGSSGALGRCRERHAAVITTSRGAHQIPRFLSES